ncbi:hypothetical protein BC937DRAFT_87260 [Endogone sp. FLAS-F59071]|nr:hypothetical protein BC937DRAFT_87260 [Endogone sp. FLAS-F59071]|eukprot:RUS12678.1 hypothetical protein BC937DRAFT_87260 [Endogone sp. FLAS-F59071]
MTNFHPNLESLEYNEPKNKLLVEWVYVIDLDNSIFKIKSSGNCITYRLECLPLYLCEKHINICASSDCFDCQLSSHAAGKS